MSNTKVVTTLKRFFNSLLLLFTCVNQPFPQENELEYYKLHFKKKTKHLLADTLFEKTVWRRKVSHLLMEEKRGRYRITLLMISPYPYAYKSQNYAIYYQPNSYEAALAKFKKLDFLLQNGGVLRVKLRGSEITKETILYKK